MHAIKIIIYFIFCLPVAGIGQKQKGFPKDTIYIRFNLNQDIIAKNWPGKFEMPYKDESGLYFNVIDENKSSMTLFYPYTNKADTLSIENLKNYHFSDLKEIDEKRYSWIFDNKRPPQDRNRIFQTYLVEEISATQLLFTV